MKPISTPAILWGGILVAMNSGAFGQGTVADYERYRSLNERTRNKVKSVRVEPHWFSEGDRFWYRRDLPDRRREFRVVDAIRGERKVAFDHGRVAEALSELMGKPVNEERLPIDAIEFVDSEDKVFLRGRGGRWQLDLKTYQVEEEPKGSADSPGGSPFLKEARPSRGGGEEIHVSFVNRSGSDLVLEWIDPSGDRTRYGILKMGEQRHQHTFERHVWVARNAKTGKRAIYEARFDGDEVVISKEDLEGEPKDRKRSEKPSDRHSLDGRWELRFEDHNVTVRFLGDGEKEQELTSDGTPEHGYRGRAWWSPDSKKFVVFRRQEGEERIVHLVESSPKDQVQPKLHSFPYRKPGDRIPISKPHLFVLGEGEQFREIEIADDLFPNPWSISEMRWMPDSGSFCFLYNQRGHQVLRIVSVDAATGKARTLIEDTSPTFLDYAGKRYSRHIPSSGEWIWMSERDGWNHLYLYDAESGKLKNQITKGEWVVRGVDRVDEATRQIWFRAGGIHPDQDPYQVHYCRVNFDGTGLVTLTESDGTHEISWSPDRRFFLATWSRVDHPPVVELRRGDNGKKVCEIERADWSDLLKTGWQKPERWVAKGRDGETDIFGVIFRPTTFDPKRSYPVIEKIYAGPHSAHVPKSFRAYHSAQALAELGFIVVQIDGMGTSHRSKAFHDVAWKNLRDAGFPDRIRWMQAAAETYPYLDLERVGIFGGSAGGQNAMAALLWHGDFYKAAVADCGCHDNRMDKIWWNELWMGWPVDKSYEKSSNVVNAHRLEGKLFLTVGELDRNVDPASTLQVAKALVDAGKDFDLLVVPGAGHGVGDSSADLKRRRADFFVRHLHGVEPRSR